MQIHLSQRQKLNSSLSMKNEIVAFYAINNCYEKMSKISFQCKSNPRKTHI